MRYALSFDKESLTLTIENETQDDEGVIETKGFVSSLVVNHPGEEAKAEAFPEPGQHLDNVCRTLAVDPKEVTIVNDTGDDALDRFEREGAKPTHSSTTDRMAVDSAVRQAEKGADERFTEEDNHSNVMDKTVVTTNKKKGDKVERNNRTDAVTA